MTLKGQSLQPKSYIALGIQLKKLFTRTVSGTVFGRVKNSAISGGEPIPNGPYNKDKMSHGIKKDNSMLNRNQPSGALMEK